MRSMPREPKSWGELRRTLSGLGARSVRTSGSHETWRFEDGVTFVVVRNHLSARVPAGILSSYRRLIGRRQPKDIEEPPQRRAGPVPRWPRLRLGNGDYMSSKNSSQGKTTRSATTSKGSQSAVKGGGNAGLPSMTGKRSGGGRDNASPSK